MIRIKTSNDRARKDIAEFIRYDLLAILRDHGARLAFRDSQIAFKETHANLDLTQWRDESSGLEIGNMVCFDPNRFSPFVVEGTDVWLATVFSEYAMKNLGFRVIAFFTLDGHFKNSEAGTPTPINFTGTFCVLMYYDRNGTAKICQGQEISAARGQEAKLSLYWIGGLMKIPE